MNDDLQNHIDRVKAENGEKWSDEFEAEFAIFKLCSLLAKAREIAMISIPRVSELLGIPEAVIERIEDEDGEVPGKYFDALVKFYTLQLAEKKSDRATTTNRLGALVASMSPQQNQFFTTGD